MGGSSLGNWYNMWLYGSNSATDFNDVSDINVYLFKLHGKVVTEHATTPSRTPRLSFGSWPGPVSLHAPLAPRRHRVPRSLPEPFTSAYQPSAAPACLALSGSVLPLVSPTAPHLVILAAPSFGPHPASDRWPVTSLLHTRHPTGSWWLPNLGPPASGPSGQHHAKCKKWNFHACLVADYNELSVSPAKVDDTPLETAALTIWAVMLNYLYFWLLSSIH